MKKKAVILTSFILSVIFLSCSNSKNLQAEDMEIASFNIGDTAQVGLKNIILCNDDLDLFIQFDTVFTDARCPIDATCIWEGNAEIGLSVTYKKELEKIKLNTAAKFDTKKEVFGFMVELVNLSPYPGASDYNTAPKEVKLVITNK